MPARSARAPEDSSFPAFSLEFQRFGALGRAIGSEDDLLQPHLGALQLLLAMGLQRHAALIKRDRILQVHFTLLEAGDDGLELFQGRLEAQIFDDRQSLWTCFLHALFLES